MIFPFYLLLLFLNHQEIVFRDACDRFHFVDNSILLTATVSGELRTFKLNFGQGKSEIESNQKSTVSARKFESPVFSGECEFTTAVTQKAKCHQSQTLNTLGYDVFRKSRRVFHLDFDASSFCCLSAQQMNALFEDRYSEIKSDFRKDGLYITILIRRKPFVLKVDTGYVGTISMNGDDATAFINDPCKSYENIVGKFAVYPNKWVTISDDYYNSAITVTSSGTSKVGMGIIKGFNWIVDFRKQKVYIKKNSMPLDSENVFPRDIETDIQNEKLMIVSINPKATKAKAGETITAVNGNPVTPANLCEIKALIESKPLNPRFEIQTSTIN